MLHLSDISDDSALFAGYAAPDPGRHDEAFDADGQPRPHWRGFLEWIGAAGRDGALDAARDLTRLRTESGIAFAAGSSGGDGVDDTLPVILAAADWAVLEAGIRQRAALAEAAVSDVYTSARAISTGLVPPGLVYGGTSYAAHCAGWEKPPQHWLHVYEANVARTAAGEWIVLSDRLDTPLGDGWLLANRIAAAQALAEPFSEIGVRRLASHYAGFQKHLDRMLGWDGRLALLTGGEDDPRFFSHAYLARYLGATLVEPADLTVRDRAAFVKTLDGLKRVDVLLRGVPDIAVDSLHRPDRAAIGAPALSLAARSGGVKIANAIGSSVFARRALAPFAHRLCESLLGEELLLTDAPCLWLGGEAARAEVLASRDRWHIQALTAADDPDLDEAEADQEPLAERIARIGERLCAVRTPALARTPVFTGQGVRQREWTMRVFACRTPDGWSVAPGGIAGLLGVDRSPASIDFGKDVWVLQDRESPTAPRLSGHLDRQFSTGHLRRTGRDLLSRVADEVFWLGRNAERAEAVLRTLGTCLGRHLEGNQTDADPGLLAMLLAIHAAPADDLDPAERYHDLFERLMRDPGEPGSVPALLAALRASAARARAAISSESWRYIDRLCSDRRWRTTGPARQNAGTIRLIEDSLQALAAFAGSAQENLTRNYAWRFLEMGRRIERGVQIAGIAAQMGGVLEPIEETYLRAWLTLSDSSSAYRARYMMTVQATAVADLLILDETNPRSLAYQVAALEGVLAGLPTETPYRRPEHRRALSLLTELRLADADQLALADEDGTRPGLVAMAERAEADLSEISTLVARSFFAHADPPEAVVSQARQEPV